MQTKKNILKYLFMIFNLIINSNCFWFQPERQFDLFDEKINQMNFSLENNLNTLDKKSDNLLNYHQNLFQKNSFNNMFNNILDGFSISKQKKEDSNELKYKARKSHKDNTVDQETSKTKTLSKIENAKQNSIEIIPINPDSKKLIQTPDFIFNNNSKWRINSSSNNYSSARIKHLLVPKNNNKTVKKKSLLMTSSDDKNKQNGMLNLEVEQNKEGETIQNLNIDASKSFKTLFKDNKGKLIHVYSKKVPIKKKNNQIKISNINKTQIIRKPENNNESKKGPTYLIVKNNDFHFTP